MEKVQCKRFFVAWIVFMEVDKNKPQAPNEAFFASNMPKIFIRTGYWLTDIMIDCTEQGFFYKQPSCSTSNIKNGLKVKQLAKQPPMLKTLLQKNCGWTMSKKKIIFQF